MPPRPNPHTYAELLAAVAQTLVTYPARVDAALALTAAARSPLRAASYDTPSSGSEHHPPAGIVANTGEQRGDMLAADRDHRAIIDAVRAVTNAERALAGLLGEWAPDTRQVRMFAAATEDLAIWCEHCLEHKRQEPRRDNGSRLCRWCGDVQRDFGKLPTAALYKLRDRGRITEQEYRHALKAKR